MHNHRVRAQYTKVGDLRFISHLDLTRLIERGINRARVPIAYSEGFHPMPKIVYGPALALGINSKVELVDFSLTEPIIPEKFMEKMNQVLPAGCRVEKSQQLSLSAPPLAVINRAAYQVRIRVSPEINYATLSKLILDILEKETLLVLRQKKRRKREVDIRPYLLDLSVKNVDLKQVELSMLLAAGSDGATNPKEVLGLLNLDLTQPGILAERTGLFFEQEGQLFTLID